MPHRSVLVQPLEVKGEITRVQLLLVEAVTERRCVPEVAALANGLLIVAHT